ncbi:glycoside hydrolase family 43 protein [Cellvibrio japonicus]|uniref:Beta-xylosidase/alpha-L-arabinfuranosidase, putative, gly43F n=1 Tax=Cellvibrio japonicus (strain Ueda107) TaxID=498211 RepID=B3PCV3_CELJU|nr:glycoside hydrolase family 43 protein [Cellvibrio japonicus]ACE84353.1 beta-xylosidase/alpha-L-arabinfuranosidase, putative, gly43F [Cellvibrio japonicus Ueda107]QEI11901.1 family 43 glycosylhydrolase [Cellvibrio japonicus]QEI15475.1 family 43 glycosylhydrolase [Cellvibrio japonicus]QEI19054.1 family 43 glycosylhydrolase [Cellvibrio japonicus]
MSTENEVVDYKALAARAISQPLVTHIYTADPSAHVFNGKVYIYPSHDIDAGIPFNDNGDHFGMEDYHVLRMDSPEGKAEDCGVALHVKDVPWAERQMWAPDAITKDGKYYLYFPARARDGLFKIGVAIGDQPEGPFVAEPEPIAGSYSIDPAVFGDDDGEFYLYFGGIWGGQLQKYRDNTYSEIHEEPTADQPALGARVARLSADMKSFVEASREVVILDEQGQPLLAGDNSRRYFEGPWMHKYQGKYYLSYSTGDTHFLCYATSDNPYGPFTYQGQILTPVVGWTTHHSICEFEGKWYLFYHDSVLSEGVTHLRSVKVTELHYEADGKIKTIHPYRD